jgi:hypothetical protein
VLLCEGADLGVDVTLGRRWRAGVGLVGGEGRAHVGLRCTRAAAVGEVHAGEHRHHVKPHHRQALRVVAVGEHGDVAEAAGGEAKAERLRRSARLGAVRLASCATKLEGEVGGELGRACV